MFKDMLFSGEADETEQGTDVATQTETETESANVETPKASTQADAGAIETKTAKGLKIIRRAGYKPGTLRKSVASTPGRAPDNAVDGIEYTVQLSYVEETSFGDQSLAYAVSEKTAVLTDKGVKMQVTRISLSDEQHAKFVLMASGEAYNIKTLPWERDGKHGMCFVEA